MAKLRVRVDASEVMAVLITLGSRFPVILREKLIKYGNSMVIAKMRELLETKNINYTGQLSSTLDVKADGKAPSVKFVSPEKYASQVDAGTGPRRIRAAEYQRLKEWVENKLDIESDNVALVAKRIKKKIEFEGSNPRPFFVEAIQLLEIKYMAVAIQQAKSQLTRELNKAAKSKTTIRGSVEKNLNSIFDKFDLI